MNKRLLILLLPLLIFTPKAQADEGMWLPIMLEKLGIIKDMQAKGLKLSAEDIYSVNQGSIKDAVVWFGRGCTGEVISDQGLILTNHHCGYSQIQSHSSVENDYLTDGFWAMNRGEELPNNGLEVTFIRSIHEVTEQILQGVEPDMLWVVRQALIDSNIAQLIRQVEDTTAQEAMIRSFYENNEYYMFLTETFRDIRLVGAPPSSIGKFGADTDNWMWPRHTGDFSLFRIYANENNEPADYSPDNVPYQPRHHLPISLKGVDRGDFTWIMGFPGRTQSYLSSYAVRNITEDRNPARIKIREARLGILDEDMSLSDTVRIQYASKYARVSNYYKKWIGENRGLDRAKALEQKRELEEEFGAWTAANPERQARFGNLMDNYEELYYELADINQTLDYINEAAFGTEILYYAYRFRPLVEMSMNPDAPEAAIQQEVEKMQRYSRGHFKDYNAPTDRKVFATLMQMYYEEVPERIHPPAFENVKKHGSWEAYADHVFDRSLFASEDRVSAFLEDYDREKVNALAKDPAYELSSSIINNYLLNMREKASAIYQRIDSLDNLYMQGLREMRVEENLHPNANSTMRVTYGIVAGYRPVDGVFYQPFTTLEGVIEKADPEVVEFHVPEKLQELYAAKNYGRYGVDGTMPVCFIATNHTTGGNSGSPVMDAEGNLIGTNFDRNWEGTMSDILYDPAQVRNISVDIRYTLFIIDKFAGAGHLVEEMTIVE